MRRQGNALSVTRSMNKKLSDREKGAPPGNAVYGSSDRGNARMNRRGALKRMGSLMGAAALASSALLPLTACKGKRRRTRLILYFTGTGNCLHVARRLADADTELLSIPQMVRESRCIFEADEIGVVYPIYMHMPPHMVRRFIQRAKLKAGYTFAVLTYGARKLSAAEIWDDISRRAGNPFDYIATLVMAENWLPGFDMDEQAGMDKNIPENLGRIAGDIAARKLWHDPVSDLERRTHAEALQRFGLDPEVGFFPKSEQCFRIDAAACVQCGACVDLCPRGNYEMDGKGAAMTGDCELCLACIQNCPQKAIRFRTDTGIPYLARGEKNPAARYRNEHITLLDIQRANSQKL